MRRLYAAAVRYGERCKMTIQPMLSNAFHISIAVCWLSLLGQCNMILSKDRVQMPNSRSEFDELEMDNFRINICIC